MKNLAEEKGRIRSEVWQKLGHWDSIPTFPGQEKAANLLRNLSEYQKAEKIFVPPDRAQYEVRLNILKDGKKLIMATPRLRDGFYQVDESLAEYLWKRAIESSRIRKYGKKLETSQKSIGEIDLMVTGAVAVSKKGERIGKGTGFFDWEYKILSEIGSVDQKTKIVVVVHDSQVFDSLPSGEKDIAVDYIVTPNEIIKIENPAPRPKGIDWDFLAKNKNLIKEMRPLREIGRD